VLLLPVHATLPMPCLPDTMWDIVLLETLDEVTKSDPMKGKWYMANTDTCSTVWCYASSIAIGVSVQIDGQIVEDASWMRIPDDCTHINVAELEVVVKGQNLALK